MSARIVYKDLAVDAAEDASVSAAGAVSESDTSLLPLAGTRTNYPSLERNRWVLNGSFRVPDEPVIAFWSEEISDASGAFTTPPVLTVRFTQRYTSLGLTLDFGADAERCARLTVAWFQGNQQLAKRTYYPDAAAYYCAYTVEGYDSLAITLERTALPRRRARLDRILFGALREFGVDELGDVLPLFEIDPTSRTLAENTLDWQLHSKEAVEFIFQEKQPVQLYNGARLLGTFYINDSDRQAKQRYQITCHDAIGVLDGENWPDAYYNGMNAYELACAICAPFTVEMDDGFKSEQIRGILKGKTKRQALQQLCFRLGAVADTQGGETIKIFAMRDYGAAVIPPERARLGGSVKTQPLVTAFKITTHSYLTTGSSNEVEIGGVKYYDTPIVHTLVNPAVVSSDKPNVIDISDATLVTESEADAVLQRLYEFYCKRQTFSLRFRVEGETVGDYVRANTPWGSTVGGVLRRAAINIKGKAVADAEIVSQISDGLDSVYPFAGEMFSGEAGPYLGG